MTISSIGRAVGGLAAGSPDVLEIVKRARLHDRPFIGGEFVAPAAATYYDNVSPITGTVVNRVASCDEKDVDRAVTAARDSFESGVWSRLAPAQRKEILLGFAQLLDANSDELAALDAVDVGKPFEAARSVDVPSAIRTVRWYAEAVDKVYGEVAPTATTDLIVREPLGVVAAVVPWNYPLMIASWKFAPILAAGNSLILKPAEQSPLSALRVGELAAEAGIPAGVFNVVPGFGPDAGGALGIHADVNGIAFTGSTEIGKKFFEYAARSSMKAISLECGGKSPYIILADADIQQAVSKAASGLFYNAGQSCNAPTRLIVHASVHDEVVNRLQVEAEAYAPNHPLRRGTKVGCIVSEEQLARIESLVRKGQSEGAELVYGGRRLFNASGGFYFEPTIFTSATGEMTISQEEIFGPVAPVETFVDLREAIRSANSTRYGLWANVWTNDLAAAHRCARELRAGTVAINNVFGGDITTPMGGFKESGTGRDRSLHALSKYTQLKHINFNL